MRKQYWLVLAIFIRTVKIFKYFANSSKQKWWEVDHFKFDPDETKQDSWEDWSKCMCRVSGRNVHWCWRYSSGRTKFSNILSIWANKNGDESAILNFIRTKLHRIHGRIVVNAYMWRVSGRNVHWCWEIFIQTEFFFQIFCQFEQTKIAMSRPFWIWSGQNFTGFIRVW